MLFIVFALELSTYFTKIHSLKPLSSHVAASLLTRSNHISFFSSSKLLSHNSVSTTVYPLSREMTKAAQIQKLVRSSTRLKPATVVRFFKTGKGTYGENDKFLGMSMPDIRQLAKEHYADTTLPELQKLLESEYNDERCLALVMLVEKYQHGDDEMKTNVYNFYLQNTRYINNWNLVDTSCYFIVGHYLLNRDRKPLFDLAESADLWERRIAIVSTMAFIRKDDVNDTFAIADKLLNDNQDLIHKAVGWLIREAGKRQLPRLTEYLDKNSGVMPRTMLRYAIEKLPKSRQNHYLGKK